MEDYLFDTPMWLLITLGAAGLLFTWTGFLRGRRDKLLGVIGIVLLLVGATLFTLSRIVETDKEQVVRRSRELVDEVQSKDWAGLSEHLMPDAEGLRDSAHAYSGRGEIIEAAKYYSGLAGGPDLQITKIEPRQTVGGTYTTEVSVYVKSAPGPLLVVTDVTWEKQGKVWTAKRINVKKGLPK
jgi:hypothetical protein